VSCHIAHRPEAIRETRGIVTEVYLSQRTGSARLDDSYGGRRGLASRPEGECDHRQVPHILEL